MEDYCKKRKWCHHTKVVKTGENTYLCLECESTATAVTKKDGTWIRTWSLNPTIWGKR